MFAIYMGPSSKHIASECPHRYITPNEQDQYSSYPWNYWGEFSPHPHIPPPLTPIWGVSHPNPHSTRKILFILVISLSRFKNIGTKLMWKQTLSLQARIIGKVFFNKIVKNANTEIL